jgi:hypothetical protein
MRMRRRPLLELHPSKEKLQNSNQEQQMSSASKQPIVRVSEADESTPRIDFEYIDRKYKEWLARRGFSPDEGGELGMKRHKSRRKILINE